MNFVTLIKLLNPILTTVIADLPATTPVYITFLLRLAATAVAQFSANVGMSPGMRRQPPLDLPPEDEWTEEGIRAYAISVAGERSSD